MNAVGNNKCFIKSRKLFTTRWKHCHNTHEESASSGASLLFPLFQGMLGIFFSAKSAVLIEDVPFTEEDIRNEWVSNRHESHDGGMKYPTHLSVHLCFTVRTPLRTSTTCTTRLASTASSLPPFTWQLVQSLCARCASTNVRSTWWHKGLLLRPLTLEDQQQPRLRDIHSSA